MSSSFVTILSILLLMENEVDVITSAHYDSMNLFMMMVEVHVTVTILKYTFNALNWMSGNNDEQLKSLLIDIFSAEFFVTMQHFQVMVIASIECLDGPPSLMQLYSLKSLMWKSSSIIILQQNSRKFTLINYF